MKPKNGIYFQKINGRVPNAKKLEILVNGNTEETLLIQPNIGTPVTHVRVKGSSLFNENLAYPVKDLENYTDIIRKIEEAARIEYNYSKLLRKPKIEIKIQ